MKKKKFIIIALMVFGGVLITLLFYNKVSNNNTIIIESNNRLAINVYDEEKNSYVSQKEIPIGYYDLDEELSYCENGAYIKKYDRINGKVTIRAKGQDKCYLYFFSYGDRILASTTAAYNNPNSFASKILTNNGGKTVIDTKTSPDFSQQAPVLTYSKGELPEETLTITPNKDFYFTYANSFFLDTASGKYTLKNDDGNGNLTDVTKENNLIKFSENASSLQEMYVGDVSGDASNALASYENRAYIYKIISVDAETGTISYKSLYPDVSAVDSTLDGIYIADDDYTEVTGKKTYYFRGAIDNNWVSFAGFYWRIIRINGDGSVRIIYSGTTAPTEETKSVMTGIKTQIGTRKYNVARDTAEYVGWKYTLGQNHGYENSSTIKGDNISPAIGSLDEWYYSHIEQNPLYKNKINQNQILCNDKTAYTSSAGTSLASGTGTTTQYFGPYIRNKNRNQSSLICPDAEDKYTIDGVVTGNETLAYPVGLISADEAKMAGLIYYSYNSKNYLYTEQNYWTMSPYRFYNSYAYVFGISRTGHLTDSYVAGSLGVRPVISLKSDIEVTGNGTWNDPYIV